MEEKKRPSFTTVSGSADRCEYFEREYNRGYQDAMRQYGLTPYQIGYRDALDKLRREENYRRSREPQYFLKERR